MIGGVVDPATRTAVGDAFVAAALAGVLSGLPSTAAALARRGDPMEAVVAAGTLLLPPDAAAQHLVIAGAVVHAALSLGWATVLVVALPARRTVAAAMAAGLAIAALDLGAIGRRYPSIRGLATGPQVADHLAFGAVVGAVVASRRRQREASMRFSRSERHACVAL